MGEGVEELAGSSIQREVPLVIVDGIVIYSGEFDGDCYESEFTRNRPYMDKGQRKFWLILRLSSR